MTFPRACLAVITLLTSCVGVVAMSSDYEAAVQSEDCPSPGLGLLQMQAAEAARHEPVTTTGFFVPDNGMCCIQGALSYITKVLERLRASPLAAGYANATADAGSCIGQGYVLPAGPDECFPQAQLWLGAEHPLDPTSEPSLMAAYAAEHGEAALKSGMGAMCAEIET
mmetsp:Transcript_15953/g.40615  ORF Transcript_15953/g.40615 Transcript_15953/m.40615 type:complete len:168 (-) Transcript_15953:51-554(-)